MGGSVNPPAQRARTKAPDFSEIFRSAHGSRQSSRTGAGTGPTSPLSSSSSSSSSRDKPVGTTKSMSRRSMLPFLNRKKPGEQTVAPAASVPSLRGKSGNQAYTVNTVRRSFGNGHAVLMITPSSNDSAEPPSSSKLEPPVDVPHSSLGSKLAAHFTPLRSPSRNSKTRSMIQKPPVPVPPLPSPTALSPPVPEVRAPSIESQHSSAQSRSTTPRPLRGHSSIVESGDEEDFSDLFTLPDHLKKLQQMPKSAPPTSTTYINLGDSPKKSGEVAPMTPGTPSSPSLHFPIPPSTVVPRSILVEKNSPSRASELESLSSQGSRSPSRRLPPAVIDSGGNRVHGEFSSQDERQSVRHRSTSVSGGDTDTSRVNDSTHPTSSLRVAPALPRPSSLKTKFSVSTTASKTSSGPPPSLPLPSPPHLTFGGLGPRSAPITSPSRQAFSRPRANTLSVTSNLVVPAHHLPTGKTNQSTPVRPGRANSHVTPDTTIDELREALTQQQRRNTQLQEYIATITKRHEDDRMAMTRTIEKLERNVRKKMREIEGLRWLVIHNGAVSDIDAAANLARSSLSTQDGDASDGRGPSPLSSPVAAPYQTGPPFHQSMYGQTRASIAAVPEGFSETSSWAMSISTSSLSDVTSLTTPSVSGMSERADGISRAERQRLKEERRASRALRRISAASTLAPGIDNLEEPIDRPLDPKFGPNPSMDDVLEKLQPFRHC